MLIELSQNKLFQSFLVFITVVLARLLLQFIFTRLHWRKQDRRRRISTLHNLGNLLLVTGIVVIWMPEIKNFALSIAAFSVAIMLALREAIQCLVGGIFEAGRRSFSVGDWVKIGDQFGEVIDTDWLSTTLLEINPHGLGNGYTGITLYIPNSVFFSQPVKNLNFMRRYIEHTFSIVRKNIGINPFLSKEFIVQRVREHCESFREVADRYCKLIESRMGVELSGTDPEVSFTTNEWGHDVLTITLFCPREEATNIEQRVTEDFYAFWHDNPKSLAQPENETKP